MSFQQYNVYPGFSPVRVVATSNQSGTYFNGLLNNGVGATLTYATGVLTIDSVVVVAGDSVALVGQTNANENGLYICTVTGVVGVSAVLQRRADMQNIEQLKIGQYVSVGAGTVSQGSMFVVCEPLPANFGIDNLVLSAMIPAGLGTASTKAASDNTKTTLASVNGATTINRVAVFSDVSGTIQNQTKANGTEAANAVTASGLAGVITTSALTTAGGASYAITWTNTFIAAGSTILLTLMGGTNTVKNITLEATAGAGSSTLTIYNNTAATALNGTLIIGYEVL